MAAGRIISQQLLRKRHHIQSCIQECLRSQMIRISLEYLIPPSLTCQTSSIIYLICKHDRRRRGKDVVTLATEPETEERRLMGFKWIFVLSLLLLQAACYRRLNGSVLKSRKMALNGVS
ncbi:unnamed protein product [Musa hybrid cultivar]